jgi:hypothetical protein
MASIDLKAYYAYLNPKVTDIQDERLTINYYIVNNKVNDYYEIRNLLFSLIDKMQNITINPDNQPYELHHNLEEYNLLMDYF